MLELAGRESFGVGVAYFLQLESAFKADRVVEEAAHEEDFRLVEIARGEALDFFLAVEDACAWEGSFSRASMFFASSSDLRSRGGSRTGGRSGTRT